MEEFLNSGNNPLKIMATEKWLLKNKDLINRIDQSAVVIVPDKVLASAVTTKNPDGVAALVEIASIPNPLLNDDDDLILVLDRIQDPGNMGNLFRTALATGVNQIILAGGAHPLSQKVLRSSGMIGKMHRIRDNPLVAMKLGDEEFRKMEIEKKRAAEVAEITQATWRSKRWPWRWSRRLWRRRWPRC